MKDKLPLHKQAHVAVSVDDDGKLVWWVHGKSKAGLWPAIDAVRKWLGGQTK